MKISIVTVCFNSSETIRDTIESVKQQSYNDIEYVIVDGGSSDDTLSIVSEYAELVSIVISEPDDGIYDAMNKGIRAATGDYVGILNSDDVFADMDSVSKVANHFKSNPDSEALYADLVFVDRKDVNRITRTYSSKSFKTWKMRIGIMVPHPTFYAKRDLFNRLGYYKLTYRVAADFELMARFFSAGISLSRLPQVLVKMRQGGISTTGLLWCVHQNLEIVRACRENGIYTNVGFVSLKIPYKLTGYLR